MNICIFAGRLTRDPEVSYSKNNTPICRFSIAVESWKKDEQGKKISHFLDFTAFGKPAENIHKFFHKADEIKVSGEAEVQKWVDKTTGQNRSKVCFTVQNFWFGQKATGHPQGQPAPQRPASGEVEDFPDFEEERRQKPEDDEGTPF